MHPAEGRTNPFYLKFAGYTYVRVFVGTARSRAQETRESPSLLLTYVRMLTRVGMWCERAVCGSSASNLYTIKKNLRRPGYAKSNHGSNHGFFPPGSSRIFLDVESCPSWWVIASSNLQPGGHWTSDTFAEKKARKIRTTLTARP